MFLGRRDSRSAEASRAPPRQAERSGDPARAGMNRTESASAREGESAAKKEPTYDRDEIGPCVRKALNLHAIVCLRDGAGTANPAHAREGHHEKRRDGMKEREDHPLPSSRAR